MREAHPLERQVGVEYYASDAEGVGGRLRDSPGDFRVREVEGVDPEPLSADADAYPHLLVRATLRDWDTNAFVGELSDRLGISRERVSWAGTKDKRAVTTQLISVDGADPADLPEVPGVDLEPVGRFGRRLLFGDLAGNAFEVVVREPERPGQADPIAAELRAFGRAAGEDGADSPPTDGPVGVPNVFGMQRFGSRRPVTHEVGLRIVEGDWAGAVLAYVGNPHDAEPERTRAARQYVDDTRDWAGALERMPGHLGHERAMLHSLVETGGDAPGDFQAALESLPSNLQSLFVNAAQSYAFNRMLSRRMARGLPFGRAVEGDVVCFAETVSSPAGDELRLPDADRTQRVTADRVDTVNRHVERGRAFVTAPLVGTDTRLGEGEPGEIERAVLDDLGIEPADFELPGAFGSSGTRRAILVRTDLTVGRDPLAFSFTLPKGSYATVVLREFLKTSPLEGGT